MSAYDPQQYEANWYTFWEKGGFFKADALSLKPKYTISIPPPNVTGVLHMGHALVDTLQDVLVRYKRMDGHEALWVPGTDHAGIATQTVVERAQMAKTGKRRKDFPRDEFVNLVWEWKEKSQTTILNQLRRLGCSCDWDRLAFTLDEPRCRAVETLFKKMFDDGLIYRGDYLVNWDPVTQTALADDEVEYEDRQSNLWYMRYPLTDGSTHLIVATTRPETMLGDTAVAVNPKDERYASMVGKTIRLPLTDREIPIIADSYVDAEFGTGVVKITPAHDPNDYEMGLRHDLEQINIMTPDGKVNELGGEFAGLSMEEARLAVAKKLESLGLMEKVEAHQNRVGVSYRSKAVIEPYLSKQWFVRVTSFKDKLINVVKTGKVKIIPKDWESTYFHWIENLRDWCISRQLWWGHRIPVFYNRDNPDEMVCGDKPSGDQWIQDEDVLDTWFSSALWPFSILGWPDATDDLKAFFPNSVLITGHDILFFWVARMILMSEYVFDQPPFPETFLHGLIYGKSYWRYHKDGSIAYVDPKERLAYDLGESVPKEVNSKWEKMSKSKGNVIDPLEIIDTYGTDAMRIALCSVATHARQIDLDRRKFEEYKNFINKIWNASRFVLSHLENFSPGSGIDHNALTLEDQWILSRLNQVIPAVRNHLDTYAFDRAASDTYHFFWDEFCAYYLELVKPTLFGKVGTDTERHNKKCILLVVLCSLIRLFHPMIPFVTEELFHQLKSTVSGGDCDDPYMKECLSALSSEACIIAPYPNVIRQGDVNPSVEKTFAFVGKALHAIRTIRAEMQLSPGAITDLYIEGSSGDERRGCLEENEGILRALTKLGDVHYAEKADVSGFSASQMLDSLKLVIPLPQEMLEKEKQRLMKLQEKLLGQERGMRAKLGNPNFIDKAPPDLVANTKAQVEQLEKELADIGKKLLQLDS